MRTFILAAALALSAAACGGGNPAAPTAPVLGTFGTILDNGCGPVKVTVSIDGVVVRTIGAGESATKQVSLGTHTLAATSVGILPVLTWNDTRVLTASAPDFISRLFCK